MTAGKWPCTVRDGKFLEPCEGIRESLQGANPTKRDRAGLYLVTYAKSNPFTPTRTFAILKSGEHSAKGIVVNVCPFCGTHIDEMVREPEDEPDAPGIALPLAEPACPIDRPGTACVADCPEHCRKGGRK